MLKLTARNLRACCPIVALELAIVNLSKCFHCDHLIIDPVYHRLDQRQGSAGASTNSAYPDMIRLVGKNLRLAASARLDEVGPAQTLGAALSLSRLAALEGPPSNGGAYQRRWGFGGNEHTPRW